MVWTPGIESRSLLQGLAFHCFSAASQQAHSSVNPLQHSTERRRKSAPRGAKGQTRPGKLNRGHLGLLWAEHQQGSWGHAWQCTNVQIQPGRVTTESDDSNQHQRLYHNPPSKSYPKSILASGKDT